MSHRARYLLLVVAGLAALSALADRRERTANPPNKPCVTCAAYGPVTANRCLKPAL